MYPCMYNQQLTYLCYFLRIVNYTPDMARADVDEAIKKGLEVWGKVTPLTFTKISKGVADIMIAFRKRGKLWKCEKNTAISSQGFGEIDLSPLWIVSQSMVSVLVILMAPWDSLPMPFLLAKVWVETFTLMRMKTGPRMEQVSPILFMNKILLF